MFGAPIRLTVNPKDVEASAPQLSIMSPLKAGGQDICLSAGFYPQEKTMILTLEGEKAETLSTSTAVLHKSNKKYYYAGFSGDPIQKCKVDEVEAVKVDNDAPGASSSPGTDPKGTQKQSVDPCDTNPNSSNTSAHITSDDPKMNSMTLLVTGLRILLAKCVAVNVLMTVKAFLF